MMHSDGRKKVQKKAGRPRYARPGKIEPTLHRCVANPAFARRMIRFDFRAAEGIPGGAGFSSSRPLERTSAMTDAPLGSKANPSQFDCLPDLAEDEPYFVIRCRTRWSSCTPISARDRRARRTTSWLRSWR
jgi:hypothetical protein